jgi:hypothetical protein
MGGQGRYKHSIETKGRLLLDKYKKGSSRAKKDGFVFVVGIVANCVEGGACKVR